VLGHALLLRGRCQLGVVSSCAASAARLCDASCSCWGSGFVQLCFYCCSVWAVRQLMQL
jgi:hypothetical protein